MILIIFVDIVLSPFSRKIFQSKFHSTFHYFRSIAPIWNTYNWTVKNIVYPRLFAQTIRFVGHRGTSCKACLRCERRVTSEAYVTHGPWFALSSAKGLRNYRRQVRFRKRDRQKALLGAFRIRVVVGRGLSVSSLVSSCAIDSSAISHRPLPGARRHAWTLQRQPVGE